MAESKDGTNVNEIGYTQLLNKANGVDPVVDTAQTLGPQYDSDYSDNIDIEQYQRITLTTTTNVDPSFMSYAGSAEVRYKDQHDRPPTAFVFLIEGIAPIQYYRMLPFYNAQNTLEINSNSFIPTEMHRWFSSRDRLLVSTNTTSSQTFTYDVFIIRDKFGRTN